MNITLVPEQIETCIRLLEQMMTVLTLQAALTVVLVIVVGVKK